MTTNYALARNLMVEQQVRPWDVLDFDVLEVLARMPREAFTPKAHCSLAYMDFEIPLNAHSSMMKPVIEGRVLQALKVQPTDEVLEIGTGSGYLTACLAALGRDVLSLEIDPVLAAQARINLDQQQLGNNVNIETVDALHYQTERRFDVICVTAAMASIPFQWAEWLRPNGRLLVIHGDTSTPSMQATLLHKNSDSTVSSTSLIPFTMVNGLKVESLFETHLEYLQGAAPVPQFQF